MRKSYERAALEVIELGLTDIVTASQPTVKPTGPSEIFEQITAGTENMQDGGTSGIDWND